jgi:hypothetical protein
MKRKGGGSANFKKGFLNLIDEQVDLLMAVPRFGDPNGQLV